MSLYRGAMRLLLSRSSLTRGLSQGVATAAQVHSTATRLIKARREPAAVARRKYQSAKRRLAIWGLAALGALAWLSVVIIGVVHDGAGLGAMAVVQLVLVALAVLWLVAGTARAGRDVWTRRRTVTALPPPPPERRPVSSASRADLDLLGEYSDSLRSLVPLIGVTGLGDDRSVVKLRREVLRAADAAEVRIRTQADELSRLQQAWRSAPESARDTLTSTAAAIAAQVRTGVADYAQLVSAATEAVSATAAAASGASVDLGPQAEAKAAADRLRGLARGLSEVVAAGGSLAAGSRPVD